MANQGQKSFTVRLSNALIARLDSLAIDMTDDPMLSPRGEATRADALRLAVTRGLEAIENEKGKSRR